MKEKPIYDSLTGLLTKESFLAKANEAIQEAKRENNLKQYGFVFCNIKNFKLYNLNYGVEAGDEVLKFLADRILAESPEGDFHARFASDHIVTLFRPADNEELPVARISEFQEKYSSKGLSLKVGIYFIDSENINAAIGCDLAKIACDSIYDAIDNICIYNEDIKHKFDTESYVLQHFAEALEQGYIKVYYQPVMRSLTQELCGLEALARWDDPVVGKLTPAEFIPVLESNHLITKLDLHMLHLVCRDLKEYEENRLSMPPVSVNLSRADFTDCEIWAEVEKIVREYGIARDLINIEITESIVAQNPEYMRKIAKKFQITGYQVWMDDFGSGYSSLNVLKDFQFDEIKLDMKFLATMDENSKKIIESMLLMAKRMGFKVVAEGVETQEQYDYLRSIGCDKVQGYLFSKPMPLYDLMAKGVREHIQVESRRLHQYYDEIGRFNFITDDAFFILEYDGHDFKQLYYSDSCRKAFAGIGVAEVEELFDIKNSPVRAIYRQLRDAHKFLHKGDEPQKVVTTVRGRFVHLRIECIAEHGERAIFRIEMAVVTQDTELENKEAEFDTIYRMMFILFDSIYLGDLATGLFRVIMHGESSHMQEYKEFHKNKVLDMEKAAEVFIHPEDRAIYRQFTDKNTLLKRLKKAPQGYISQYFRTLTANGAYVWKIHIMTYVPNINSVIYCSRYANLDQDNLIKRVAPEYLADAYLASKQGFHQIVRKGLMESQILNMFWKDKERRFVGVNNNFLQTYGFDDEKAVLGKTDEDMGWHVNAEPFENDEWRVLENGEVVRNALGKCIIKGVNHTILACKEPLYKEGEIVGLLGYFIDVDSLKLDKQNSAKLGQTDFVTKLMSSGGIANAVADYMDCWETRKEDFAVIRISLPEYHRISLEYGDGIARKMLNEIGSIIMSVVNVQGVCGRLFAGNFVVLMKCIDKKLIKEYMDKIMERLESIHVLFGYPVTFMPEIDVLYASEAEKLDLIIGHAVGGSTMDVVERSLLEEKLNFSDLQFQTVVNALPGGVMLHEMLDEQQFKVVYASAGAGKLSGKTAQQLKDALNADNLAGVYPDDIPYLQEVKQEAARNNKTAKGYFRILGPDKEWIWISMQARVIGEKDGHLLRLVVYQNLSGSTKSYEEVLNDSQIGVIVAEAKHNNVLYTNHIAEKFINEDFGGSIFTLHKELLRKNVTDIRKIFEKDVEFEDFYHGRHFSVRLVKRDWHGREAIICYLTDSGASYGENRGSMDILNNSPSVIAVFVQRKYGDLEIALLNDRGRKYMDNLAGTGMKLTSVFDYVHPEDVDKCRAAFKKARTTPQNVVVEYRLRNAEGEYFWVNVAIHAKHQEEDDSYLFYTVYTDINEHKRWEETHLIELDETDTLPKAETERRFTRLIEQRNTGAYSMLMLDVDNMKYINDSFGHPVGDKALHSIVAILRSVFRRSDIVGKVGGDEFMVFLDGLDDEKLLREKLNYVMEKVNAVQLHTDPDYYLQCSIGAVIAQYGEMNFKEIYDAIDAALYKAKHQGKNKFVIGNDSCEKV